MGEKMNEKSKRKKGYEHKCLKCGYEWIGRKEHPSVCARCLSKKWNDNALPRRKSFWVNEGKVVIDLKMNPNDAKVLISESIRQHVSIERLIINAVTRMICSDKRTTSVDFLDFGGQQ